jgi:AcrR family transcriptional regulator
MTMHEPAIQGARRDRRAPVERRGAARAAALKEAALALFAERGYAAVTIKDIAGALGVNSALIYYYFENKEDLFHAAIDHAVDRALESHAALAAAHDEPEGLIRGWLRTNAELAEPIRRLVKVMMDDAGEAAHHGRIAATVARFYAAETTILSDAIRAGIAAARFRPVDAEGLARFVSVHLDGIMVAATVRQDFAVEAAIGDLENLLWRELGAAR